MSDMRDGLKIGAGLAFVFALLAFVFALPIGAVWGVVIVMAWLQKAVGL